MSPELQQRIEAEYEEVLRYALKTFGDDKPARRQCINDSVDVLIRNYDYEMMRTDLPQREIVGLVCEYKAYLIRLACGDTFEDFNKNKRNRYVKTRQRHINP
jgi:hypothetical protein